MALTATHPYARPLRGSTAGSAHLTVIEGSRGRPELVTLRSTELADLIDELTAAGMDMVAMASRLDLVVNAARLDLVPEIASRLRRLGVTYRDCAKPEGAA